MKRVVKVNKETLNAMLPPIPADFEQDMRNMLFAMPAETGKETKGKPMKKRISVGFVLAVVFTLLAASALASPAGESRPWASPPTSFGTPPTAVAQRGRPQAMASRSTLGWPSLSLGRQKTEACA